MNQFIYVFEEKKCVQDVIKDLSYQHFMLLIVCFELRLSIDKRFYIKNKTEIWICMLGT